MDEGLLRRVVECIQRAVDPQRIILFGSAAAGTMTADSDIDLLVIARDLQGRRAEITRLRLALGDLGIPVDVFSMTPERFEETKNVIGGMAYPAHKYGKVIYETTRPGQDRVHAAVG